jgi:hypothetical protein
VLEARVGYGLVSPRASSGWLDRISQDLAGNGVAGLMPDDRGRGIGELALDAAGGPSGCLQTILRRTDYTEVTPTNVTTGHVYRLTQSVSSTRARQLNDSQAAPRDAFAG